MWHTARAEYQRGIMDAFTDPSISDIVMMTSAQVGKSEILINCIGYISTCDPGPILFLQPTLDMAEAFSKDRVAPVIRETPIMREKFDQSASRDAGATLLHKQFAGGQLTMSGANSPASLASRPIRILLADEIDKYPASAGAEGDPLSLAEKRTNNFWNRKRVKVSTPTVKGISRIEAAYNESDKRRFFVPCPHCQEPQALVWGQVKWDKSKPETARYECAHCGVKWSEGQKCDAVALGEWRASQPFRGVAGFHINELYSPWRTLPQIADDFLRAENRTERLKVWVNTTLGEVWDEARDVKDPSVLRNRAEDYPLGAVPAGALLVTMGVDVQGDRLEAYTWGYGEGEEAWVLDFRSFYGDPARPIVWDMLLEHIGRPLAHELGPLVVPRTICIDSGGLHTHVVYSFCRNHAARRTQFGTQQILAIQGQSQPGKMIMGKPTPRDIDMGGEKIHKGILLWPVGSSAAKQLIYARLNLDAPGSGYIHTSKDLPEDFWDQLVAERLMTKYVRGFPILEWHLPSGKRNEALDCAVYAYAAACQLGMPRMRSIDWKRERERLARIGVQKPTATPAPAQDMPMPPQQPAARPPQQQPQRQMPRSNWTTGWR